MQVSKLFARSYHEAAWRGRESVLLSHIRWSLCTVGRPSIQLVSYCRNITRTSHETQIEVCRFLIFPY
jgi:hypothetical protein